MTTDPLLIDCDGHILEPADLWEIYLEPAYRDRALRIRVGEDGFERFPLRVVVLESQAGWIGYFLDRADATFTGTPLGATEELRGMVAPMTESGRRGILGENVARAYRLV